MRFKIGDKVIHWSYGLGEIVGIEDRIINDRLTKCYVLQTSDLTIWVPVHDQAQQSLRLPTSPDEFDRLFEILSAPGEALLEDRVQRKDQLMSQMRNGQLESICCVVRDLSYMKQHAKLNDQEKTILERAMASLLTEWTYSLGMPMSQAQQAMASMLGQ